MDKKNTIIGAVLMGTAIALFMLGPKSPAPTQPQNAPAASPAAAGASAATPPSGAFAAVNRNSADAKVATLANDLIEARFTHLGGAILEVAFKQYPATQGHPEPYVFNQVHEDPILAFSEFPGLGRDAAYELVSATANEVVYRAVLDGKVEVTRRYQLTDPNQKGGDPYRIRHETTFRNLTGETLPLPRPAVSLGTASLINASDAGQYLNIAHYDGDAPAYIERSELDGGGFGALFGAGRPPKAVHEAAGQVVWAGAKNQFFTTVFTPDKPAAGVIARRIELPAFPDSQRPHIGLTGALRVDLPALAPNASTSFGGLLYVGPQEYRRLSKFDHSEDRVLPYTQFFFNRIFLSRYVAPLENTLLNFAHNLVGNWGVAVIVMTLILKLISLPFTIAASRSAKRMAKLQPEMVAIREKYKDNPQKQQMATMELFKKHKVNPVGGCIPILITMPLFVGFFAMLQSAAELRFQPFLWAPDLSAPDTVARVFGFPINIMPILMGVTMIYQMKLTPTPSVDKMQATMMKFMPVIFVMFCYNFSCALALYSTINGIFTIAQQMVINRMKDDGDAAPAAAAATSRGKPMKNVTPAKKKG